MKTKDPWFFEERAFWFASLMLTARGDVTIRRLQEADRDIDLLVEIRNRSHATPHWSFGVQLVPCLDLPAIPEAKKRFNARNGNGTGENELPICVFVIGVRKPEGIYRWMVEPAVENGQAVLHRDPETNWQALDEAGAARLIDQVKAWYDLRTERAAPRSSGRHAKAES